MQREVNWSCWGDVQRWYLYSIWWWTFRISSSKLFYSTSCNQFLLLIQIFATGCSPIRPSWPSLAARLVYGSLQLVCCGSSSLYCTAHLIFHIISLVGVYPRSLVLDFLRLVKLLTSSSRQVREIKYLVIEEVEINYPEKLWQDQTHILMVSCGCWRFTQDSKEISPCK